MFKHMAEANHAKETTNVYTLTISRSVQMYYQAWTKRRFVLRFGPDDLTLDLI